MVIMKIDLSKLSFWKSVLLVALSAAILLAAADFLIFRTISNVLTPMQTLSAGMTGISGFDLGYANFSGMFLYAIVFASIISAGLSVFFWWVSAVANDYSAVRIFKLQSNYDHLIPASAIIYSAISAIVLISILISLDIASNILWRISIVAISWLLYMTAIKDIYDVGWKKAFLIPLLGALMLGGIAILGYLVGVGLGLAVGLML